METKQRASTTEADALSTPPTSEAPIEPPPALDRRFFLISSFFLAFAIAVFHADESYTRHQVLEGLTRALLYARLNTQLMSTTFSVHRVFPESGESTKSLARICALLSSLAIGWLLALANDERLLEFHFFESVGFYVALSLFLDYLFPVDI